MVHRLELSAPKREARSSVRAELPWASPGQPGPEGGGGYSLMGTGTPSPVCDSHRGAGWKSAERRDPGSAAASGCPGLREGPQFFLSLGRVPHHPDRLTAHS